MNIFDNINESMEGKQTENDNETVRRGVRLFPALTVCSNWHVAATTQLD